jgi:hypothetical protein
MLQPEARLRGSWLSDTTSQLHRSDVPDLHWLPCTNDYGAAMEHGIRGASGCAAACCNAHRRRCLVDGHVQKEEHVQRHRMWMCA